MSLREQIETAVGREVEVQWAEHLRIQLGIAPGKPWREYLDRHTDRIDFVEVLEGRAKLGPHPLLVLSHFRGGVFLEFRQPAKGG